MNNPRCIGLLSLALATLLLALPAHAARLALVIGNDAYRNLGPTGVLKNAGNDADTMAAALRKAGYTVTLQKNRDLRQTKDDVRAFRNQVAGGDEVVLYFSGHGVQLGSDNYLLPVDVRSESEYQVRDDGLPLSSVLRDIRSAYPAFTLAVIDACRDNPFEGTGKAIGGRGLTGVAGATGQMVIYAAGEGQRALDRLSNADPIKNGVFTRVFVKEMERPGVPIDQVLKNVRIEVNRQAQSVRHEQVPAIYDQVLGNFYFFQGQVASTLTLTDPEQEAWDLAKRGHTAGAYEAYVRAYPQGRYAQAAQVALAVLRPVQMASIRPEPVVQSAPLPLEQAVPQLQPQPVRPSATTPGQSFKDCADCPEMVVIPAGSFMMGSNDGEAYERPPHIVNIKSFALGKYEVTQGQWRAIMDDNPSEFSSCGDSCPVESVSWNEIQRYIQKLNAKSGHHYRLPSEAEWEYAARGGSTGKWSFGSQGSNLGEHAWYNANSNSITHTTGQKKPNSFGLYDVHGNVGEAVQDCHPNFAEPNYIGAPVDGSAMMSGSCGARGWRGGSYSSNSTGTRVGTRGWIVTSLGLKDMGFRLARTAP
jgi:formylglycine-generating enzyme required for sulfatase activity